jgi:hypothetical protein
MRLGAGRPPKLPLVARAQRRSVVMSPQDGRPARSDTSQQGWGCNKAEQVVSAAASARALFPTDDRRREAPTRRAEDRLERLQLRGQHVGAFSSAGHLGAKVFHETPSGARIDRAQLALLLKRLERGDTVLVTQL